MERRKEQAIVTTPISQIPSHFLYLTPTRYHHIYHQVGLYPYHQPCLLCIGNNSKVVPSIEMKLQDYKEGNVIDIWDPPPFFPIPSSLLFHFLWDMITNDKRISSEIWNQFIDGNVPSITFCKAKSIASSSYFILFYFRFIYIIISMITPYITSHHHAYTPMSA